MQPIASTRPSSAWTQRNLRDGATCTTLRRASSSFQANWEILAWLASTRSKLLDLDVCPMPSHPPVDFEAQPTNHRTLGFEAKTKKPSHWFWGPNHQTIATGFEAQTGEPEPPPWFWSSTKKPTTAFEAKPGETIATGYQAKPEKPSPPVLRPNQRKPSLWFWGQTIDKLF
jgi:hypothetical protein